MDDNANDDQLRKRMIIINPEKMDTPVVRKKLVLTDSFSPIPDNNQIITTTTTQHLNITLPLPQKAVVYPRKKILEDKELRSVIDKYNAKNMFNSLYRLYTKDPTKFFSMHKSDFGGKPKRRVFKVFRSNYKSTVLKC